MKNVIIAMLALAGIASARAEEAKPADELSLNVAVTSDYRYRGISQTRLGPAFQIGVDHTDNREGWYVGAWATNVSWIRDAGGRGRMELDLYAGQRGKINAFTYDVGVLGYVFPSNNLARVEGFDNANTAEIYGQLGLGNAYVKYSHAVSNAFGFEDSRNSGYLDLGYNLEWKGNTVNLHVGHQRIAHHSEASYTDWKIGISRELGPVTGSLALVGTDAKRSAYSAPDGKFNGKTGVVATIGKTF